MGKRGGLSLCIGLTGALAMVNYGQSSGFTTVIAPDKKKISTKTFLFVNENILCGFP